MVRRYFYPLISDFPMYEALSSASPANLPVARTVADRVLCLPIYPDLSNSEVLLVVKLISAALFKTVNTHLENPRATRYEH